MRLVGSIAAAAAFIGAATLLSRSAVAEDANVFARFASSRASVTSYVGTGSFVEGDYADNPLWSEELSLEPRFHLDDTFNLHARFSLECELTEPDSSVSRRCAPSDLSLGARAHDLLRDPWLNGQVGAGLSLNLPTSLESRFNHTIVNLRASGGYTVTFFSDRLSIGVSLAIQKYLPSRRVRGPSAGEGDGGGDLPLFLARRSATEDGSVGSGGRYNDSWSFTTSANIGWAFTDALSLSASFGVYNYLRFAIPDDALSDPGLPRRGRAEVTAGTLEAAYRPFSHLGFALGVTSAQPALTADGKQLRFPFYDFVSPSNNFTRWYLAVHLTH